METVHNSSNIDVLVVGSPFKFMGGGQRRVHEVIRYYPSITAKTTLYIPYSHLVVVKALSQLYEIDEREIFGELEILEKSGIHVPQVLYIMLERTERDSLKYFKNLEKGGITYILENLRKLLPIINKEDLQYTKQFLKMQQSHMHKKVVYVMDNFPEFIYSGSFISEILGRPLFILLQSIPINPVRDIIMKEYIRIRRFYQRSLYRTLSRLSLVILQQVYFNCKSLYIYSSVRQNLRGLFSVSQVPLKYSKLDEWARKNGILTKVIVPGNSVNEPIRAYLKERESILKHKEDCAIFYGRLGFAKGLFEIPLIAKYLQQHGYELFLLGRFDNNIEKALFERLCKQLNVKNIKYLGFLEGKELYELVARSKVLIYPSHYDAFPLVVLESLFLGNHVVAYNIL
ncbi:MAG: glycosyltransferase [Desulfurococcaceae archaeon]